MFVIVPWEGILRVEGQEPGMSKKPGRDLRKELLLESNNSAKRAGRVKDW